MDARAQAPEARYVHAADGVRLALTLVRPSGRPRGALLLLHGFAQNRNAFMLGKLPFRMAEIGFLVGVGELRGHGLSDRPDAWTLEDLLARDVPRLGRALEELGEGIPVHFIGHSLGGVLGYASLAGHHCWASVTGIASPLRLGRGSVLVPLAATVVRPLAWLAQRRALPIDRLLAALSGVLSIPRTGRIDGSALAWGVQRFVGLTNTAEAEPWALGEVLRMSDPESMTVFRACLEFACRRTNMFGAVDVLEAVRHARIPVASIVGGQDIFASASSVGPLGWPGQAGPRRIVVLGASAHVDLTVGERVARAVEGLVPFWEVA